MPHPNGIAEDFAQKIIKDWQSLTLGRANFESQWNEIAERIIPSDSNSFYLNQHVYTDGDKRTQELFDSTGAVAIGRFAAILDSLLTPRNQTWHKLTANNPYIARDRNARLWFEETTRILFQYRYGSRANFVSQNQKNYKNLGAYGNAAMYVDYNSQEPGLRYKSLPLGELYFAENHQGQVDTVYRHFALTPQQALKQWGERVPPQIASAANTTQISKFFFLHCVKPNPEMDSSRLDFMGMKYLEYYISINGQTLLDIQGYNVFPYAIGRYEQFGTEVYGRGPATDVLPALKTLNLQKKAMLKQGQKAVDPVLLVADDGVLSTLSTRAGSAVPGGVNRDGRPMVHALPVGNIALGKEMMDMEQNLIRDVFLVNLFQILIDTPQMTATEVLELSKEKGMLLAPTLGRQEGEYLGNMIERELDILNRQGLLPPMPPLLLEAQGDYKIEFDSPLSRAQRAEEASGLLRTIESTLNVVNVTQDPSPLDHFNWDTIVPEIAQIQGVPERWMRAAEEIADIREGRAQQAEAQQAIQAAPAAAAMMKGANGK